MVADPLKVGGDLWGAKSETGHMAGFCFLRDCNFISEGKEIVLLIVGNYDIVSGKHHSGNDRISGLVEDVKMKIFNILTVFFMLSSQLVTSVSGLARTNLGDSDRSSSGGYVQEQDVPLLAAPELALPPGQVAASHNYTPDGDSFFRITLSGFSDMYDVVPGVPYKGWCIEDNGQQNTSIVQLFSSYDLSMPLDALTYQDPGIPLIRDGILPLGAPVRWNQLNYLLNHKQGTMWDIQAAIWLLIWGETHIDPVPPIAQNMVTEALSNGANFEPGPGDVIAVILYADGIGPSPDRQYQDSIIELPIPDVDVPAINVVKTANPITVYEPGGEVTFTVDVTNLSSPTDPVTITSLVDDVHGDLNGQGTCAVPFTLQPGETYTCQFTALVEGNAGYVETDTVTASGTDDEGYPVSDYDDATVTILDVLPSVDLVKDVTPSTLPEPGGDFLFTLTIYNTSPEPVVITALVDDNPLPEACTDLVGQTLPVGGSASCSYTVAHTEVGSYLNTASVTVQDDDGNSASDTDDETVTVTNLMPAIEVVKTADPVEIPEPGGEVVFTVEVTNLSNPSDPVTITSLVDDIHGDLNGQGTCAVPFTLQFEKHIPASSPPWWRVNPVIARRMWSPPAARMTKVPRLTTRMMPS